MNKLWVFILLFVSFVSLAHLPPPQYYRIDEGAVYYKEVLIPQADSKTFQVVRWLFGKDKNHVYFQNKIVKGADPASFISIQNYAKDKNRVYLTSYSSEKKGLELRVLPQVDSASFQYIASGYAKDKYAVFYYGERLPKLNETNFAQQGRYIWNQEIVYFDGKPLLDVDAKTFNLVTSPGGDLPTEILPDREGGISYVKDKNTVYYQGEKIKTEVDAASFEIAPADIYLSPSYYKDKDYIYFAKGSELTTVEGADLASFKGLSFDTYAVDKSSAFYAGKMIEGSDGRSFSLVDNSYVYARDKKHIYYRGKMLAEADVHSFTTVKNSKDLVKDHRYIYSNGDIIQGIHAPSFEVMDSEYSKDKKAVYYYLKPIKGADPKTFVYPSKFSPFSADKSWVFYREKMLPNSDAGTFKLLKVRDSFTGYAKDKGQVYFYDQLMPDADMETFEATGFWEARDKNTLYQKTKKVNFNR